MERPFHRSRRGVLGLHCCHLSSVSRLDEPGETTGERGNLRRANTSIYVVDKVPSKAEREGQGETAGCTDDGEKRSMRDGVAGGCAQERPSASSSEGRVECRGTKAQPGRLESPYEITIVLGGNHVGREMSVFNETNDLTVLRVVPEEDRLWELASVVET
ncbi:hypothetical protein OE88DRAFT_1643659 [Heliocybe sulcata]|uniref:Uncharacterized protein n=1 Tax=Heliocybe sulcata TaxID=5364 RepID=A0A5C3N6S9_9AGAM|nr:hypothetical protein OE88DRAFT_1643659 [Heliocybe sulcata]